MCIYPEKFFTKSMPATQKMKLKGGAAVDPDSNMEDSTHVLEVKGEIYNAVLGMVDIVKGTNSYYKLQILESDKASRLESMNLHSTIHAVVKRENRILVLEFCIKN